MSLDLTNPNVQHLIESGFSVTAIEQSPTLVRLLNQFNGSLVIDSQGNHNIVGASSNGSQIKIAKGFNNLPVIAHEIAHAIGHYQAINNSVNNFHQFNYPKDYAMARAKAEGEATYYEFLVSRELGYTHFKRPLWQDNQPSPKDQDMFEYVNYVVNTASSEADIIHALAMLNQDTLSSGQLHHPLYTYDEYNTLVFLNNRFPESRISTDFQQAMGIPFDWNTYEAKSLANKANNFYGTMGDDVILNQTSGGSALGQQGQGDLLWGSAGQDVVVGNSGKDILLGGSGNDVLIGGAGTDILAGGAGNDLYYFNSGFEHDTIVNAGGGVDNVYFANIDSYQLTLISQEKNDLTLSLAPNDVSRPNDQLTIKGFFLGGDNASLNVNFGQGGVITGEQILSHTVSAMPIPNHTTNQTTSQAEYDLALAQLLQMLNEKIKF